MSQSSSKPSNPLPNNAWTQQGNKNAWNRVLTKTSTKPLPSLSSQLQQQSQQQQKPFHATQSDTSTTTKSTSTTTTTTTTTTTSSHLAKAKKEVHNNKNTTTAPKNDQNNNNNNKNTTTSSSTFKNNNNETHQASNKIINDNNNKKKTNNPLQNKKTNFGGTKNNTNNNNNKEKKKTNNITKTKQSKTIPESEVTTTTTTTTTRRNNPPTFQLALQSSDFPALPCADTRRDLASLSTITSSPPPPPQQQQQQQVPSKSSSLASTTTTTTTTTTTSTSKTPTTTATSNHKNSIKHNNNTPTIPTKMKPSHSSSSSSSSNHTFLAKKPTTVMPIQKTLLLSSTTNAKSAQQQQEQLGEEHALLRLMQQGKIMMTTTNKGKQRIRPRKKKFSALKKKVLEERLKQYQQKSILSTTKDPSLIIRSNLVVVLGFVTPEDEEEWNNNNPNDDDDDDDDDEYQEICNNFHDMAQKIGEIQKIWIPRQNQSLLNHPHHSHHYPVFVQFQTVEMAERAIHAWNGLTLGGNSLQVMTIDSMSQNEEKAQLVSDEIWQAWCTKAFQEHQQQKTNSTPVESVHTIELWNALTEDDLEDDECLQESVQDIRILAESFGPLQNLQIEKDNENPRITLTYNCNLHTIKLIATQLNQVTLSGNQLLAKVLKGNGVTSDSSSNSYVVVLRNVLTAEDIEDDECLEESVGDIEELAKQFGVVEKVDADLELKIISIHYASAEEKVKALIGFQGMVIGGQKVSASTTTFGHGETMEDDDDDDENKGDGTSAIEPMFSGDKRIPERFAECKRVPKIPNSGQPRHYAVLSENETVKPLLTEMLAELMRLQKRAAEDKNAKARRRLVMGLREVARGIRARKVRMVVMANNLDEYGALDDKLQEILDLAHKEEVPVFFEFSKRALGKAIGKTIKVAVIGIQNPDGANQQFKKLSLLAPALPVQASSLSIKL